MVCIENRDLPFSKEGFESIRNAYELALEIGGFADSRSEISDFSKEGLAGSVKDRIQRDLLEFMLFLAKSDGVVERSEIEYINRIMDRRLTADYCEGLINYRGINAEDFSAEIPTSVRSFLRRVGQDEIDPYVLVHMFEFLGEYLIKSDRVVTDLEKLSYESYMDIVRDVTACNLPHPYTLLSYAESLVSRLESCLGVDRAKYAEGVISANPTAVSEHSYLVIKHMRNLLLELARIADRKGETGNLFGHGGLVERFDSDLLSFCLRLALADDRMDSQEAFFLNILFDNSFDSNEYMGMFETSLECDFDKAFSCPSLPYLAKAALSLGEQASLPLGCFGVIAGQLLKADYRLSSIEREAFAFCVNSLWGLIDGVIAEHSST